MRRIAAAEIARSVAESPDAPGVLDGVERTHRALGGMAAFVADVLSYDGEWLLDICCGPAELPRRLVEEARSRGRRLQIVALDASDAALRVARERTGTDPLVRFVRADARCLPYPDGSFDIATCRLAMHLFDSDDAVEVLRELRRVARATPLVFDVERTRLGAFAAATVARFGANGRPTAYDASLTVKRAYTLKELEDLARVAGWPAPAARRSGLFHVVLRDGE